MDSPAAAFAPIPPHSTEAERSVLGAMLQNGNAVSTALEILVKDDFYVPAHQAIFEAAKALNDQHSAIDLVTMNAELSKRGTLPGVGGIEYLIELTQFVPTTANVKDYIRIVAEKSTLRRLITASGEISQASYAQEQDLPQVLAMAEAYQRGHDRAVKNGIKPGIGIAVLMVGRLDDYLRDVMNDTRAKASEADIIWSGTAAIKRAYGIFNEKGYDCVLMPAGCRGGYHITELAGANMVMSVAPGIARALLGVDEYAEKIDAPVDAGILERLSDMAEFRKAYAPDGMKVDEFITFGSCNRTLDQFVLMGWNILKTLSL